tara:strand:+ start:120 stop:446 length:327 start_codon:yes stop_codon:yes gene_type:complete
VKNLSPSQLISVFFGLTSEDALINRKNLFHQIHEICFHGKGGYDWNTVYNMPIWLRKFTFNQIQSFYQKETEDLEKAKQKSSGKTTAIGADGKINPAIFKRPTKSSYN